MITRLNVVYTYIAFIVVPIFNIILKLYSNYHTYENGLDGICHMNWGGVLDFSRKTSMRGHIEDVDVYGSIILTRTLRK